MRRFALRFVRDPAVADDVVQDAWLAMLRGLDRFEGRSSLATWLVQIVSNIAKTKAVREARTMPFSAFKSEAAGDEPAVAVDRFFGPTGPIRGLARIPAGVERTARGQARGGGDARGDLSGNRCRHRLNVW